LLRGVLVGLKFIATRQQVCERFHPEGEDRHRQHEEDQR